MKLRRAVCLSGLILGIMFINLTVLNAQILKDSTSIYLLKKCVDDIYNFKFDEARTISRELKKSFPDHPVNYLLKGMITYWENFPMKPGSALLKEYDDNMNTCIRMCEEMKTSDYYPEILLSDLGARGMLMLFYADNNMSDKVYPIAKTTYRLIRQSFDYTSYYDDFYFFTGLYNYYREAYPEARPVYKILALFFPKGDKAKGLTELQRAARSAIMLKAESATFLAHIYTHYENNYQMAFVYSRYLNEMYPDNVQYLISNIKNLMLLRNYDEAEKLLISSTDKEKNLFYAAQAEIFNGILQEKKYRNYALAKKFYINGLTDISSYGYYGNEFSAYANFGLSRISEIEGDKAGRKAYRKIALDLTSYKKVNFDD
jgi:hypothetical protein